MEQNISERYKTILGLHIFYRYAGNGPVLFLLHPSPRSSKMLIPLMKVLASHYTVIAPDTPGYGCSDPLPSAAQTVYDYLPLLHAFFSSFHNRFFLYGNATGAQMAIAYTLAHPNQVTHLFTDNAVLFTENEIAEMNENYFPEIPASDAALFIKNMVIQSCLFFPWYKKEEAFRISSGLPPEALINDIVNDYLLAGSGYATAYKAAMLHEKPEYIVELIKPATFFQWEASPVIRYMKRITAENVPSNIKIVATPADVKQRYTFMRDYMLLVCGL